MWRENGARGECSTEFGVVTRPHPGFAENGDAYLIRNLEDGTLLVGMVDGLGHGPEAAEVAERALSFLASASPRAPDELLRGCHQHLQGTRGAAVALAHFDPPANTLAYCGVGNIEARIVGANPQRPISYNGIVGAILPRFQVLTYSFQADDLFFMHTDGISARFTLDAYPDLAGIAVQLIAEVILRDFGRAADDATMLVARYSGATL